ncbi:hypothetical protein AO361_11050 [Pseudomonas fluorescens]|nr:hypothetical protein AO361_11050 [Pseudomonas fluorescens]
MLFVPFEIMKSPVGASLLAMVVNDNAGRLVHPCALRFFASKLAPTVIPPNQSEIGCEQESL